MEKIRLKDGTEFELIPMGIDNKDKLRIIKFISALPYEDILAKFTDVINLECIEHILADNGIGTTYEDCTAFKSLTFIPDMQVDDNIMSDIYVVVFSTDAVERELQSINSEMINIVNTVVMMSMPKM